MVLGSNPRFTASARRINLLGVLASHSRYSSSVSKGHHLVDGV
jgi:hypothetical protein